MIFLIFLYYLILSNNFVVVAIPRLIKGPRGRSSDAAWFERLSLATYRNICEIFDKGYTGKDWKDLAAWLGLTAADVSRIGLEKYRTDHVIQRWAKKADNDMNGFVEILERNEMTWLAEEIKHELNLLIFSA